MGKVYWEESDCPPGRQVRTREGWIKRCAEPSCEVVWRRDPWEESPFPMFILEHAEHEATHGLDVVGYNVPLVSN